MVFSSFIFLCFFLPLVLLLHIVLPGIKVKNAMLVVASLIFYAYGEPVCIILMLVSVLINYVSGRLLENGVKRKATLVISVLLNLGLLVVFKYSGFIAINLNKILPAGAQVSVPNIALPIGISFYTFQALSYVIDVYWGRVEAQHSYFSLLLYISFFPQLIAGPIVRYKDVSDQILNRKISIDGMQKGIYRFCIGLGKKILIANTMASVADAIYALPNSEIGMLSAWVGAIAYLMQIYFDFSGYSDMAIGLGSMFGFSFNENFNYPYIATSIQDFWRRWHISLSTWFREYLYIPLGGNRKGENRAIFNRYVVFFATGIWHGANWTFLFWGIYHGTFLMLESSGIIPIKKCKFKPINYIYSIFVVLVGFVFFRADTIGDACAMLAAMFGFGTANGLGYAAAVKFLSPYYIVIFILACIGATPLPKQLFNKMFNEDNQSSQSAREIALMVLSIIVILFSFMQLAADSYNPFIYFRF